MCLTNSTIYGSNSHLISMFDSSLSTHNWSWLWPRWQCNSRSECSPTVSSGCDETRDASLKCDATEKLDPTFLTCFIKWWCNSWLADGRWDASKMEQSETKLWNALLNFRLEYTASRFLRSWSVLREALARSPGWLDELLTLAPTPESQAWFPAKIWC